MLKYQKTNKNNRPDSLLSVIFSSLQLLLVVIGLVGISVEFFRDQGWLKQTLSAIMNSSNSTLLMALPVGFLVLLVGKSWVDSHGERESANLIADAMLYLMMLVGVWTLYKFFGQGGF